MATKTLAKGIIVKNDHDVNATFDVVGEVYSITAPGRKYTRVPDDDLASVRENVQPGIEELAEFEFMQYFHDGDTAHERTDTLFGSKAITPWQVIWPYGTARTWEFSGRVMAIEPETMTNKDVIARKVTVVLTSAITRS